MIFTPVPTLAVGGTGGSIRGQLVDSKSGAPIAGATVAATSPSGSYKATTDGNGGFTFLQIPTDTYILSFQKQGYESHTLTGVTVIGDSTVDLGKVTVGKSLTNLVTVTARSQTSAFQPSQTQDTYTVSGQRITQALGNAYSTDEGTLLQSVPGVIPTFDSSNGAGLSVRGSLNVELGYQFDGVPFTAPFFAENGSAGFLNNIAGGSGGGLQVVSGAGDATQGNSGGGTINTNVPRGTYPGNANFDFEVGAPFYNHTFNFNDSFATQNGRISNYFAYSGVREVPAYAPFGANANVQTNGAGSATNGNYFGVGYVTHDDLIDNFVFRFGKNANQSIQILDRTAQTNEYAGLGGLTGLQYFSSSPNYYAPLSFDLPGQTSAQQIAYTKSLLSPIPYQPTALAQVTQADELLDEPLQFLKFEYTNNLNSSTYLSATYFNWDLTQGGDNYSEFPATGFFGTDYQKVGGSRTGFMADITKTIADNQTITLEGKYENDKPFWDLQVPAYMIGLLEGDIFDGFAPRSNQPQIADYYLPQNVGQPVSASNPCIGPGSLTGGASSPAVMAGAGGCYLYSQLLAAGKFTGSLPLIPSAGISYHGTDQQQWGLGLRDQYSPTNKLHLDFGVRVDGEQNLFGEDQLGSTTPSDVSPSKVDNAFIRPRDVEPRAALSYQLGPNDSVRLSFGRSVQFFFGQTLGTPFNLYNLNPIYDTIAAKDTAADPGCGSGTHGPGPGYTADPNNFQNGANQGAPAYFYKCQNYGQALASLYDQQLDAPDLGGFAPPTYSNYDIAFSHQIPKGFFRGWAAHATAYARTGYDVEQNVLLLNGPPNPISGQSSASIFTTTANGSEKTFGLEGQITTPEIAPGRAGASGYATIDYISQYTNTPAVAGGSALPILGQELLTTGEFFRSGYIPPLTLSAGFTYQTKHGIRITPSLLLNNGYAFGVGRSSLGYINGVLYTVPQANYGVNVPYGGIGGPGHAYNASYYADPQVPGSTLNPNIVGSRGYSEPAVDGNGLSPSQAYLNLNIELPIAKNATLGLEVFNLTNNQYSVPQINTLYQPVGHGVSGPQSGTVASSANYASNGAYSLGAADTPLTYGGNLPYTNGYGAGINFNVYGRFKI